MCLMSPARHWARSSRTRASCPLTDGPTRPAKGIEILGAGRVHQHCLIYQPLRSGSGDLLRMSLGNLSGAQCVQRFWHLGGLLGYLHLALRLPSGGLQLFTSHSPCHPIGTASGIFGQRRGLHCRQLGLSPFDLSQPLPQPRKRQPSYVNHLRPHQFAGCSISPFPLFRDHKLHVASLSTPVTASVLELKHAAHDGNAQAMGSTRYRNRMETPFSGIL